MPAAAANQPGEGSPGNSGVKRVIEQLQRELGSRSRMPLLLRSIVGVPIRFPRTSLLRWLALRMLCQSLPRSRNRRHISFPMTGPPLRLSLPSSIPLSDFVVTSSWWSSHAMLALLPHSLCIPTASNWFRLLSRVGLSLLVSLCRPVLASTPRPHWRWVLGF